MEANKTSLADAAAITGLKAEDIAKAAAWIAEPKEGRRRRAMFAYEHYILARPVDAGPVAADDLFG